MNETRSEYEELSRKLSDFENEYRSDKKLVKGAAIVFVVLLAAFFGFSLSQIGKHVDKALSTSVMKEAETKAKASEFEAEAALKRIKESEDELKRISIDADPEILKQIKGKKLVPIYRYNRQAPYRELLSTDKGLSAEWTKMTENPYFYVFQKK